MSSQAQCQTQHKMNALDVARWFQRSSRSCWIESQLNQISKNTSRIDQWEQSQYFSTQPLTDRILSGAAFPRESYETIIIMKGWGEKHYCNRLMRAAHYVSLGPDQQIDPCSLIRILTWPSSQCIYLHEALVLFKPWSLLSSSTDEVWISLKDKWEQRQEIKLFLAFLLSSIVPFSVPQQADPSRVGGLRMWRRVWWRGRWCGFRVNSLVVSSCSR